MKTYNVGDFAFINASTFDALIPCRVIGDGGNQKDKITVETLVSMGTYEEGKILCLPFHRVIPAPHVSVMGDLVRIDKSFRWWCETEL